MYDDYGVTNLWSPFSDAFAPQDPWETVNQARQRKEQAWMQQVRQRTYANQGLDGAPPAFGEPVPYGMDQTMLAAHDLHQEDPTAGITWRPEAGQSDPHLEQHAADALSERAFGQASAFLSAPTLQTPRNLEEFRTLPGMDDHYVATRRQGMLGLNEAPSSQTPGYGAATDAARQEWRNNTLHGPTVGAIHQQVQNGVAQNLTQRQQVGQAFGLDPFTGEPRNPQGYPRNLHQNAQGAPIAAGQLLPRVNQTLTAMGAQPISLADTRNVIMNQPGQQKPLQTTGQHYQIPEQQGVEDYDGWSQVQPVKPKWATESPNLENPPLYGWEDVDKKIEWTVENGSKWATIPWINKVRPHGEWDFKHDENRKAEPWAPRERAGNVTYGATCVAAGYDPQTCLRAGGLLELPGENLKMDGWMEKQPDGSLIPRDGRPWDSDPESCKGEDRDDCRAVKQGIQHGLQWLKNNPGRR
ncbi:polymorphic toxin type 44 domain-containing protein [Magnetofaba australis]|nr:polymorphic toxin type 44 domain-containing protein [Magnetofaba australis]